MSLRIKDFSWVSEWLIASGISVLIIGLVQRQAIAFWGWALRSRPRDFLATLLLGFGHLLTIAAITVFVPLLNHVFGIRATADLGEDFLIVEAASAGTAAYLALGGARSNEVADGIRAVVQAAAQATQSGLFERANDCVPRVLAKTFESPQKRTAAIRGLRSVLGKIDPVSAAVLTTNISKEWDQLDAEAQLTLIEAISGVLISRRIPPHRVLP